MPEFIRDPSSTHRVINRDHFAGSERHPLDCQRIEATFHRLRAVARGDDDACFDKTHGVAFLQKNRAAEGENP